MSSIPKSVFDSWAKAQQKIIPPVPRFERKKTDKEILDNINIEVIEKYLRKKKLEKIINNND